MVVWFRKVFCILERLDFLKKIGGDGRKLLIDTVEHGVQPIGGRLISKETLESITKNNSIKIFSCKRNNFENYIYI
jgi:hypothetical protein